MLRIISFVKKLFMVSQKKLQSREKKIMRHIDKVNESRIIEDQYHMMINEVEDYAIILLDTQGNITSWNKGAEKIKQYKAEEIIGKNFRLFYTEKERESKLPEKLIEDATKNGKALHEGWRLRKDGTTFWGSVLINALKDEEGRLYGFLKITRDFTERKKAAEQLELLSMLINRSNDSIYTVDAGYIITSWNHGAEKLYEFSQEEAIGKNPRELLRTYMSNDQLNTSLEKISNDVYWSGELKRKTKSGNEIYVHSSTTTLKDGEGNATGYVVVGFDITREKKLREEINHLATMVENSSEAIISRGLDGRIISWNKGAEKLLGFSKEEAIGKKITDIGYMKFELSEITDIEKQISEKGTWGMETTYFRKNGSSFFGTVTGNSIKNEEGEITAFVFIIRDISKRKQVEDELKKLNEDLEEKVEARTREISKNEKRFRALIENNNDVISLMDESFKIVYRSPSAARVSGRTNEEMERPGIEEKIIHPDDKEKVANIFREILASPGNHINISYRIQHKNGHYLWTEGTIINLLHDEDIKGLVFNMRDVTERKLAEENLKSSEEHYRALFEQSADGIFLADAQGNYADVNAAGCRMLGYSHEEITHKTIADILIEEEIPKLPEAVARFARGAITSSEWHFRRKDGTVFIGEVIGRQLPDNRLQGILRDITERKKAEEQLKQNFLEKKLMAERMSAILNTLPANIALLDANGVIIDVNESWKKFADDNGYSGNNYYIGDDYIKISENSFGGDENDGKMVAQGIKEVIANKVKDFVFEYPCHSPNTKRWFRMVVTPLHEKKYSGAVVMHIDISELRRLEQERMQSKMDEQKKISQIIFNAQEKERNAIGAELHDNVNQILAGTNLYLSIAKRNPEKCVEYIESSMGNIQLAIEQNRRIAHELVVPDFEESSLSDMLGSLTDNMLKKAGIEIKINSKNLNENLLSDEEKLAAYRIAQEQCTNIIKHAEAHSVKIFLSTEDGCFKMKISDDGKGMDDQKKTTGIGLRNIKGRLNLFNGELNIETSHGKGFALEIKIPL